MVHINWYKDICTHKKHRITTIMRLSGFFIVVEAMGLASASQTLPGIEKHICYCNISAK